MIGWRGFLSVLVGLSGLLKGCLYGAACGNFLETKDAHGLLQACLEGRDRPLCLFEGCSGDVTVVGGLGLALAGLLHRSTV